MVSNLPQIGSQVINSKRFPVYALPNGTEAVPVTEGGRTALLSVEGAKAFKTGQYPLHPDLDPVVSAEFYGETPFSLRSEAEQDAQAHSVLTAVLDRLLSAGIPLTPSAN